MDLRVNVVMIPLPLQSRGNATAFAGLLKTEMHATKLKYRRYASERTSTKVPGLPAATSAPPVLQFDLFPARARRYYSPHASEVRAMKTTRSEPSPKLVVVIDDDPLVLEATDGLLRSWGCQVVTADSYSSALARLAGMRRRPDLIVCDYRLPEGTTGIDAIEGLRSAFEIPALLISGDASVPPGEFGFSGYNLLHKPVDAARFRAALINASVL
jgi:CheY-like chemotaxis protein